MPTESPTPTVIRNLDENVKYQDNLAEALMATFSKLGGVELDIPLRDVHPRPLEFDRSS
ncbi:MAG TPA: hypothetical protein VGM10_15860 [Actinocrinis sp.]|jgi:hypothetical protein